MTDATRREFLEVTGASALAALSASPMQMEDARSFDGYGLLIGPEGALPDPNGEYFAEFDTFQFAYHCTDSQNKYYISDDTREWRTVGCIVQKNGSLYFRTQA